MTYGTEALLAIELAPDPVPANAQALLARASDLVLDAAAGAVYSTTEDGRATDARVVAALDRAATLQAAAWILAGVDPRKGVGQLPRVVASKSLGAKSVSYQADPAADAAVRALAAGDTLGDAARSVLANAGLLSSRVQTGYGDGHPLGIVHVGARAYDPVTGNLGESV